MMYVKDDSVKEPDGEVPAGYRAVEVEIGISDGTYIEVLSGLKEGDEVYRPAQQFSGDYMGMDGGIYVEAGDTEYEDSTEAGDDYGTATE